MIENVIDNTNKKLPDRIINNVDEILKIKSQITRGSCPLR